MKGFYIKLIKMKILESINLTSGFYILIPIRTVNVRKFRIPKSKMTTKYGIATDRALLVP